MKKIVLSLLLTGIFAAAGFAADTSSEQNINMTPKDKFSGYSKSTTAQSIYPSINTNVNAVNRNNYMKPKSVKELSGGRDLSTDTSAPMTYERFPQNVDSSNMLHMQGLRNGIQNMYMGF